MTMTDRRSDNIMRIKDVVKRTGLHRATIGRLVDRGHFPQKLTLSPGCVGFYESDVEDWIAARDKPVTA